MDSKSMAFSTCETNYSLGDIRHHKPTAFEFDSYSIPSLNNNIVSSYVPSPLRVERSSSIRNNIPEFIMSSSEIKQRPPQLNDSIELALITLSLRKSELNGMTKHQLEARVIEKSSSKSDDKRKKYLLAMNILLSEIVITSASITDYYK
ncbi:MAG: hypothetical protein Gaeavirus28_4 [Gaeavirus sp.]|uniref:Uncharacterized protein n=1 Tax=Gaeavirus sp. TaxID=2487767 RepID=A0A3G4ZZF6_9VIRU|nr:MAG: hypothetical protein Gaeavirus28_4 [Gaeavirus sp.]